MGKRIASKKTKLNVCGSRKTVMTKKKLNGMTKPGFMAV
jgi:hypothetical protein